MDYSHKEEREGQCILKVRENNKKEREIRQTERVIGRDNLIDRKRVTGKVE
jgi:hypothetical protein